MNPTLIRNVISKLRKKALSGDEMLKLLDNQSNLITYPELSKMQSIDEALGKHNACVILYETKKHYGHWCCIFKNKKKCIEFFDPYGLMPDDQLKFIPMHFRKSNNEKFSHLTYLLWKSGCSVEYNHTRLQKKMKDINTCGRWCSMRIGLRHIPLNKFVKLFTMNKYLAPDDLVTALTYFV